VSETQTFMMGEYEASFPVEFRYAKNHMWAKEVEHNWRFGLSAYAVRLLQDVYFLDLTIEPGMNLQLRQEIGSIESKKAESSLYSPVAGTVTQINEDLLDDPTAINLDKYGAGWMFSLDCTGEDLLPVVDYMEHLNEAWEIAQRIIKGQANA